MTIKKIRGNLFNLCYLCAIIPMAMTTNAQSLKGITNQPDTSYSTYSAYKNTIKTNPETKIVPEFKGLNINEKREVEYLKMGNKNLKLDAFYPKKSKNATAIVIIHGGGWRSGNRQQHIPLAQKLASLGYACFTVEYRLSTEALFPAAVQDIKAAIRWVKAHRNKFGVNPNKVAVLGFSAGGQLAALIGTTVNNPFFEHQNVLPVKTQATVNAIIDLDGILAFIHPESGEGDDSKKPSAATYWFGYSKTENPDLWRKGSALSYVDAHTPPTLFINSSVDRMHAGRNDYIAVLNKNKIYSEIKTFEKSPHSFPLFEPWFSPMVATIDGFLRKVLQTDDTD